MTLFVFNFFFFFLLDFMLEGCLNAEEIFKGKRKRKKRDMREAEHREEKWVLSGENWSGEIVFDSVSA